jgi:NAD(P)-dependent dehydrogenase (short-subunit alcohol dehydrogenase family)
MTKLCEGRIVIVTGAARGIGREYALGLAAQGARVVVNDLGVSRDGEGRDLSAAEAVVEEIRAAGGDAIANGDDVSDWNGAKHMIDSTVAHYGDLHAVINNAGILRDRTLVNMEEHEWDAVIKVHMKGTFAPSRHAAAYWRERHRETGEPVNARIINTSSSSGLFGNIGQYNYGGAKAGIAAMTIIAARELKRYGVTVNAISPAAHTRMTEGLRQLTPEQIEARHPRWIAAVAIWLCSEQSRDITARVFEANGGILSVLEGWHRGPNTNPIADPTAIGPVLQDLASRARRNADMRGQDAD